MHKLACLAIVVLASSALAATSPLSDALAAWHMADLAEARNRSPLVARGDVQPGVTLEGADRDASLARGGDGRAVKFNGGYLDAGQGGGGVLNPAGRAFTLAVRLRDPSGNWNAPLLSKHGGHDKLVYNLFSHDFGQGKVIGFELGTEGTRGMTQVIVPLDLVGSTEWHDIVCRFDGAKLQLFVDGVWMDEGFPVGALRQGNAEPCLIGAEPAGNGVKSGWRGLIDHAALWSRALSDAEVETLSGGPAEVASRRARYLGDPPLQYFRPHNQFNVGDTLPFFHDGTFHFYYLLDRGHHTAKGGLGAHQWAHASSKDLVHWTHHPLAVPITSDQEGSICTGSMFFHAGTWYAFYASRLVGKGEHLSLATSPDGIHFTKTQPNPFLSPGPKYGNGFRDPHVFLDARTSLFHLIVSTMLREGSRGCLAHYTSKDLKQWTEAEPFLVEGNEVPECPDYFQWNGWYYLIFSNGQVAHYRMSRQPLGPWQKPKVDVLDGPGARVIKTAAFTGNRRLATASIWPQGYAGTAIFRELVQRDDGTLGARFVPEMVPATGDPAALALVPDAPGVSGDLRRLLIESAEGTAQATLSGLPANGRIRLRVDGSAATIGLRLRASRDGFHDLRIVPSAGTVALAGGHGIAGVAGLDRPFALDIVLKDNIIDACVNGDRTLVNWAPVRKGDWLILYVEKGRATFTDISASPATLLPSAAMGHSDPDDWRTPRWGTGIDAFRSGWMSRASSRSWARPSTAASPRPSAS